MKSWEAPQFDCQKPGCGAIDSTRCTEPLDQRSGKVRDLDASLAAGCRVAHYTKLAIEDRVAT
jgi:hypothetical protein